jgi:hypothetical protein
MDLLDLVLKYEPVLKFSKDGKGREENFFPISAANYVAESALHEKGKGQLKERKTVTLDHLGSMTAPQSRKLYLTFAADKVLAHDPSLRERLQHGGLELFSVDGDMTPQLVVEGQDETSMSFAMSDPSMEAMADPAELDPSFSFSGPGNDLGPAGVSFGLTDAMQLPNEVHKTAIEHYEPYLDFAIHPPIYYYSSLFNRGYHVLQYWFFYAYNDWGSGHDGVNDHEADWEMIALFLRGEDPVTIAYSAHTGNPVRHAWSDSAVEKVGGTHPVIYVGCGSHANYFHEEIHDQITFKDFARGDSAMSIGPDTPLAWGKPVNLGAQPWALNYAGGWGALVKRFGTESLAMGAQAPVSPPWQFRRWESPVDWAKAPWF